MKKQKSPKSKLVEEKAKHYETDEYFVKCLTKNVTGNVLWVVWEYVSKKNDDIFRKIEGCVFHTDYSSWTSESFEQDGFDHNNCPIKFLKLVPEEEYPETTNPEWRKKVYEHFSQKKTYLEALEAYRLLDKETHTIELELSDLCDPQFLLLEMHHRASQRGMYLGRGRNGRLYRIPRKHVVRFKTVELNRSQN